MDLNAFTTLGRVTLALTQCRFQHTLVGENCDLEGMPGQAPTTHRTIQNSGDFEIRKHRSALQPGNPVHIIPKKT